MADIPPVSATAHRRHAAEDFQGAKCSEHGPKVQITHSSAGLSEVFQQGRKIFFKAGFQIGQAAMKEVAAIGKHAEMRRGDHQRRPVINLIKGHYLIAIAHIDKGFKLEVS